MSTLSSGRWVIPGRQPEIERQIVKEFGLDPIFAAVLAARGFRDLTEIERYLYPTYDNLSDARLLPDYDLAVKEILGAKERGDLIFVHGDYDVDGITSAALLHRFLGKVGCKVHTHVPHRFKEGYGIHTSVVDVAAEMGAKLFLTCDCGSSALPQIERAKELGMRVVVTDHHLIGDEWPKADAFVNPKRPDSLYPYLDLSGVGVVFRLCEGIAKELGLPVDKYFKHHIEYAALGTIADVMPLTGDNRIIAKMGLAQLGESTKPSIKALKAAARETGAITSRTVGFGLAPRINAAGRLEDAALALELLLADDLAVAQPIAAKLEAINESRKQEQNRIFQEALEMVEEFKLDQKNLILVAKEDWHGGVVGIVAGKIRERFNRPTFVMTKSEEDQCWKGSGRSIDAFHLADAIKAHPELMKGGGHAKAAGCHFPLENLEAVRAALEAYAGEKLTPEDLELFFSADVAVSAKEVTPDLFRDVALMEPCGMANPGARFYAEGAVAGLKPTKTDEHWQLEVKTEDGVTPRSTAFQLRTKHPDLQIGTPVRFSFSLKQEEWQGRLQNKWAFDTVEVLEP